MVYETEELAKIPRKEAIISAKNNRSNFNMGINL